MPRGTQLGQLITMFREEAGHSPNPAHGKAKLPQIKAMLRRIYRRLHADYHWPHLRIQREITLQAGQQYYAFPADLDFERIVEVVVRENGRDIWYPLHYGIDYLSYNVVHSSQGEREDFPHQWEIFENDQMEVWPIPETTGHTVRFEGYSRPKALVEESETVDLDDDLIVLYAVGESMARDKSADAELKLQQARQHYMALRGNSTKKRTVNMRVADDREPSFPGINIRYAERRE